MAASTGCDLAPTPDFGGPGGSLRSAEAEIVRREVAGVAQPTALALEGEFDGPVVWAVMAHPPDPGEPVGDHPPDPGAVACLAGIGPEAFFAPAMPGAYVLRALVLDPETLEVAHEVETEVFIEGDEGKDACMAEVIPSGLLPSIDEVAGIEPTPFHDDASGIDPTPFHEAVAGVEPTPFLSYSFDDGTSVSAGCVCAYE